MNYICYYCGEKFRYFRCLKEHLQEHGAKPYYVGNTKNSVVVGGKEVLTPKLTEATIAGLTGSKLQLNSGRFWFSKGDMKYEKEGKKYLVDIKTGTKGVRITPKMWYKIEHEAYAESRKPALFLAFPSSELEPLILVVTSFPDWRREV